MESWDLNSCWEVFQKVVKTYGEWVLYIAVVIILMKFAVVPLIDALGRFVGKWRGPN